MKIQVKIFATLRLRLGISGIEIESEEPMTVMMLLESVSRKINADIIPELVKEGEIMVGTIILINGKNILHAEKLETLITEGLRSLGVSAGGRRLTMKRYSRHIDLLGESKFGILRNASVMVAGAGGLGCTVLTLLARMGVGTIHFFEYAEIDAPDLNRQMLYDLGEIGEMKSEVALKKLKKINPDIEIIAHGEMITPATVIPKVDLVFDCLDNFTSRYVLDDLIFPKGIPMVHAGVGHYFGQLTVIIPGKTECLRKTISVDAAKFDANAVKMIYPPVVTVMASLQVSEGVKYLIGDFEHLLFGKILIIDLLTNTFEIIEIK